MAWWRKKHAVYATGTQSAEPGVFVYITSVGDATSKRTISSELMAQLLQATKDPALAALDRQFGGTSWCSEIKSYTSLEGPCIHFKLTLALQPGQTQLGMGGVVGLEFERRWEAAAQRLLT